MRRFFFLSTVLMLLAVACTNDNNIVQGDDKQNDEPNVSGLTAFVSENEALTQKNKEGATRTTAQYDGDGLSFYWTEGDRLWVNKAATGTPDMKEDLWNNITERLKDSPTPGGIKRAAYASFYFSGSFPAEQYKVRYIGRDERIITGDKVIITGKQKQDVPNDASHIGLSGDCGTGTARRQPNGGYTFMLDHQASYVTFLPYSTQSVVSAAQIKKIRVWCNDKAICGEFKFTDDGINIGSRPSATDANRQIELTLNDFPIPASPDAAKNAAIMVIAPGTYTNFSVEYTLYDSKTDITGTITKTYPSVTFTAGKNKKVSQDLQVTEYSSDYYAWDAKKDYWYGHESYQPFYRADESGAPYAPASKEKDPLRWYNDVEGYHDITGAAPAVVAMNSAVDCPNVNKTLWYVGKGDPHFDTELWSMKNHLYSGRIWFKKQSLIAKENGKEVADLDKVSPDGVDYTRLCSDHWPISTIRNEHVTQHTPDTPGNYFCLPIGGAYESATFKYYGQTGYYWTSTPSPKTTTQAFHLICQRDFVAVDQYYDSRTDGYRLWKAE